MKCINNIIGNIITIKKDKSSKDQNFNALPQAPARSNAPQDTFKDYGNKQLAGWQKNLRERKII